MKKEQNERVASLDKFRGGKNRGRLMLEVCLLVMFVLYSLRHIHWGLDLWDTGYNYANFTYGGTQHMGVMWFFSTYLANVVGHFLTMLPFGHTLIGMNFYTGLLAAGLAIIGYYFCTKSLGISKIYTVIGELVALSMCWCPTALLYNYLTYILFLICVVLLYHGLSGKRKGFLILAGVCLGTNIFVRFSNIPEAGLILAVWAYALLEGLEIRKDDSRLRKRKSGDSQNDDLSSAGKNKWMVQTLQSAGMNTLWCLGGYLAALAIGFAWIAVRYGLANYIEGIKLLFAMTETATDYQATSMLYGLIWPFKQGMFWVMRMMVFVLAAFLLAFAADYAPLYVINKKNARNVAEIFHLISTIGTFLLIAIMVYWLYSYDKNGLHFTSFLYNSYDPIFWPGVIFLTLTIGIAALEVFMPGKRKEEKLIAGLLILVLLLTSLGSNNNIYPSLNNLFIAAPYVLNKITAFTKWAHKRALKKPRGWDEFRLNFLPVAVAGWAIVLICISQFGMFGLRFSFCEGTGISDTGYRVEGNRALKGVSMSKQRARWMQQLTDFATENDLSGQKVILYGKIPAISFYLEMPAAFNTWSDLDSYNVSTMQKAMDDMMVEIREKGTAAPVVIADRKYGAYGPDTVGNSGMQQEVQEPKWQLIQSFMELCGYRKTFENEKFVIWQAR